MNIKQATEQIQGAIRAYLSKNEYGLYRIPFHMQRPIIMFGPPGVGKTAIVSQIAQDMGVNFVSYSITHHTRQSALGLPFISSEEFDGRQYSVSEYTMSEIIAAVYRARKESGVNEGILFLDEVNCVSETLAPAMLQFLQYKTFGMHHLPEGWIIVTAGNPPEYNRAAREFDPAMLDRMKRIDVEPDLQVWQEYAAAHGVHPAVTTYLDAKPGSFYNVRAGVKGTRLVTARGWEDLSRMLQAYEAEDIVADRELVRQYLQDDAMANEFFAYYELFRKYQDDYQVTEILDGRMSESLKHRAREAHFDERVALVGLLLDALLSRVHDAMELECALLLVRNDLLVMKSGLQGDDAAQVIRQRIDQIALSSDVANKDAIVGDRELVKALRLHLLDAVKAAVDSARVANENCFDAARAAYNARVKEHGAKLEKASSALNNAFLFLDSTFGESSQESLIMVTKLSADPVLIKMVSEHGSEEYMKHNKSLLFTERNLGLLQQIDALENAERESSERENAELDEKEA